MKNMIEKGIAEITAVIITAIVVGVVVGGGVYVATSRAEPSENEDIGHSDITVYALGCGSSADAVWVTYMKGAEVAAEELGLNLVTKFAGGDMSVLLNDLETAIAAEADAILFCCPQSDLFDDSMKKAQEQGITIITFAVDCPAKPCYRDGYVGAIDKSLVIGNMCAELSQKIGPEGKPYVGDGSKILYISSAPGSTWSDLTKKGIIDTLADYGLVINEDYTMDILDTSSDPAEIESRETAYILANPDIDGVFSAGCISADGMVRTMEALDMEPGEIPCFMWVCGADAARGVKEGYYPEGGVSVPSPGYEGYMGTMAAFLKIEYGVVPSDLHTSSVIVNETNVDMFLEGMERHFF